MSLKLLYVVSPSRLLRGTKGGAEVADRLFNEVKSLVQEWSRIDWKIITRVYVDGEGSRHKSRGLLKSPGNGTSFNLLRVSIRDSCYLTLTILGIGPQLAISWKVSRYFSPLTLVSERALRTSTTEAFEVFIDNIQCQHILYGCRIDLEPLRILEPYKSNVLASSCISLLGPVEVGSDLGYDNIDLIGAISYKDLPKTKFLPSHSGPSDTDRDPMVIQAPTEHQNDSTTEKSPAAAPVEGRDLPVYRFSDRKATQSKGTKQHYPEKKPYKVPQPSYVKDVCKGDILTLATKIWIANRSTVLLNINNERVDVDLGPVDSKADRNLLSRMKEGNLCHNYVLLGHCA